MLQRSARSFATVAKLPLARIRRMPSEKHSTSSADKASALQAVAGSETTSYSPALPRRSSRSRNTLQSSTVLKKQQTPAGLQSVSSLAALPVDQTVKQESPASAQPAAPTLLSASNQTNSSTSSRKRKAAAHEDANVIGNACSVADDSKKAASKASPHEKPKRSYKASAKAKPAQTADSASAHIAETPASPDASTGAAGSALQQAADSPTRPLKQRKPRTKAVIKTETAAVTPLPDEQFPGPAVNPEDGNSTAPETSSAKQARKQKKPPRTKVEVKTEVVTVAEPAVASAEDSAVLPGVSVSPKKPQKRRAKAEVSVETLLESVHVTPYRERVVPKKWVGAHVSMGGGMERAVVRAAAIGANSFALDTRSKRQWESKPMSIETADAFKQACKDYSFGPEQILPHGSYLINLASAKPELLDKSYTAFVDELKRCEMLGIRLYNFHPGSTCGECPAEEGMDRIAESINKAHAETESVIIVLENMAGGGGSVGHRFDYLHYIIDRVENKARVGVCLDTCHLFAGGYDVSTTETFEQVMQEFEEVVGLQYLKGMHVNDSKAALGSKKDRHENVAKGLIGQECFEFLMNDSRFDGMPLIMETPVQCHGPDIDYKLSLLAGAPVFKSPKPGEEEAEVNTDKRDIAWLNALTRN